MLLWMRHFEAHALTPGTNLVRAGLSGGVVKLAVIAAKEALLQLQLVVVSVNEMGVLIWSSPNAGGGAAAHPEPDDSPAL